MSHQAHRANKSVLPAARRKTNIQIVLGAGHGLGSRLMKRGPIKLARLE
jgi:hypothetical protein